MDRTGALTTDAGHGGVPQRSRPRLPETQPRSLEKHPGEPPERLSGLRGGDTEPGGRETVSKTLAVRAEFASRAVEQPMYAGSTRGV